MKHSPLTIFFFPAVILLTFFVEKSFSMDLPSAMERWKIENSRRIAMASQEEWDRSRSEEGSEETSDTLSSGELAFGKKFSQEVTPGTARTFSIIDENNDSRKKAHECLERIEEMQKKATAALIEAGRITDLGKKEGGNAYVMGLRMSQVMIDILKRRLQGAEQEQPTGQIDSFERLMERFEKEEKEMNNYFNSMIEDARALHELDQKLMANALSEGRIVITSNLGRK